MVTVPLSPEVTLVTVAVAEALLDSAGKSEDAIREAVTKSMRKWGKKYPHAGYQCH